MLKKITLTLLIGVACGYFALKGVDFSVVKERLDAVTWSYFFWATLLMIVAHGLRVLRWQAIIKPLRPLNFGLLLPIHCVGFMLVNILPLRLGELARPYLLTKRTELKMSSTLATCAVERIFDGLSVLIVLIIGLVVAPIPVTTIPYLNFPVSRLVHLALITFLPAFLMLTAMIFWQERSIKVIDRLLVWLRPAWRAKIIGICEAFLGGLKVLQGAKSMLWILFLSLLVWAMVTWLTYLQLVAFHLEIPWLAAFTVLGIICLGIMLPGPPGFAGNYELFCKAALALYAVDANTSISFAIVSHAHNLLFMVACGLIAIPWAPLKLRGMLNSEKALAS